MLPPDMIRHGIVQILLETHRYADVRSLARAGRVWRTGVDVGRVRQHHREYMAPFVAFIVACLVPRYYEPYDHTVLTLRRQPGHIAELRWTVPDVHGNNCKLRLLCLALEERALVAKINRYALIGACQTVETRIVRVRGRPVYECDFLRVKREHLHALVYDLLMIAIGGHGVRQPCAEYRYKRKRKSNRL